MVCYFAGSMPHPPGRGAGRTHYIRCTKPLGFTSVPSLRQSSTRVGRLTARHVGVKGRSKGLAAGTRMPVAKYRFIALPAPPIGHFLLPPWAGLVISYGILVKNSLRRRQPC